MPSNLSYVIIAYCSIPISFPYSETSCCTAICSFLMVFNVPSLVFGFIPGYCEMDTEGFSLDHSSHIFLMVAYLWSFLIIALRKLDVFRHCIYIFCFSCEFVVFCVPDLQVDVLTSCVYHVYPNSRVSNPPAWERHAHLGTHPIASNLFPKITPRSSKGQAVLSTMSPFQALLKKKF